MIDYSKLNKTTGPGPITKILDKNIKLGSGDNTKITFIVFNNSSKKYEKYNLSDYPDNIKILKPIFSSSFDRAEPEKTLQKIKSGIKLSSLIQFVTTYKKNTLNTLYVYDTSCSAYRGLEGINPDEIDIIIESLPVDIGR